MAEAVLVSFRSNSRRTWFQARLRTMHRLSGRAGDQGRWRASRVWIQKRLTTVILAALAKASKG